MTEPTDALIDALVAPISPEHPCGEPVRFDPAWDALREARRQDDASLPTGVWQHELKRADWPEVERLAAGLLQRRSKDIQVAAWLGEAWTEQHGLHGLVQALALIAALCEAYPDTVHPLPGEDGDGGARAGSLAWIIEHYTGRLRHGVPLVRHGTTPVTLADWEKHTRLAHSSSNKKPDDLRRAITHLREAAHAAPAAALAGQVALCHAATGAIERLDCWADATMPQDTPSFAPLKDALAAFAAVQGHLLKTHPAAQSPIPDEAEDTSSTPHNPVAEEPSSMNPPDASSSPPPFTGREQAYQTLEQIATYLMRVEPHSPVPYLIRRALEWGRKPLPELLAELIDADDAARKLWKQLGVLKE